MAEPALPPFGELVAPQQWRVAEFISDLHLHVAHPATFEAWRGYLQRTTADAVFMLGDLFEVWVGDDAASEPGFEADCLAVLAAAAARRPLFFLHGNRDFLVGADAFALGSITGLADPTVLTFAGRRWLLTHGDALCINDHAYQAFRAQVRSPQWQDNFLAQPLATRRQIARQLRDASEQRKRDEPTAVDVDTTMACRWMEAADAPVLVHGHTHRPADHAIDAHRSRVVLSDWDLDASPPRAQVLRLQDGRWQRLDVA